MTIPNKREQTRTRATHTILCALCMLSRRMLNDWLQRCLDEIGRGRTWRSARRFCGVRAVVIDLISSQDIAQY